MTLEEYKIRIQELNYQELPGYTASEEIKLWDFVAYQDADLALKIHLTKMIVCKCFPSDATSRHVDISKWWISEFLRNYSGDRIKPWLSAAIKDSGEMILSDDTFSKNIIGLVFMFGVIEVHSKYLLGYRPDKFDFFDESYHKKFRGMGLYQAIKKLQKEDLDISIWLNEIDDHNSNSKLLNENRYSKVKIVDRLTLGRNAMLHGERHNFYHLTKYTYLLYMLFYLQSSN